MLAFDLDQKRLTDYWVRRGSLSDAEWEDFYLCVKRALVRCPSSELAGLPDQRGNYIDEFFTEKIFFRAGAGAADGIQSISGGALCSFFRRFLIDQLRGAQRHYPLDSGALQDSTEDSSGDENHLLVHEFLVQIGGDEQVNELVRQFLETLDDWALLMLRGHFCADDAIPMAKLCKGIPSYHYKAQKLGITVKRGDPEMLGFEHTLIGKWITSLGVEISPVNIPVIHHLLGLICLATVASSEEVAR